LQFTGRDAKTGSMEPDELEILYEDNHLLAVNKPAGIPTQGSRPGEQSLVQVAKQYIKSRYQKPGNVFLGVVSRLDSTVTGVVVLARTSKAAARLTAQFGGGETSKLYWAVVERAPHPPSGNCVDWLLHDDVKKCVIVSTSNTPAAKEARLSYRTIQSLSAGWLVEVRLETGRKHQIRVQLAARGWPILGDKKYGSRSSWPKGIALHARQLDIMHPVRNEPLSLTAPVPKVWCL
jgi:23S rRNA pseudouridine1911/1915/1917 synthase